MENPHLIPEERRLGRASATNKTNRFEIFSKEPSHDGWDMPEDARLIRTEIRDEIARTIIAKNSSPDISFDRSINPYRGCEHGCIYCFARPSHAYLGLSPGLDFESRLIARPNAAIALRKELSSRRYKPEPIAIGTNTDAYQPAEQERKLMRSILEVLLEFRHPVTIATKGTLIERDIDILSKLAALELTQVGVSVTTLDADLSRKMEPRVPSPKRRLRTIKLLAEAGIPVRVMVSPVVPGLTDFELEGILSEAAGAGAEAASMIMLRLPREVSELFQEWLAETYANRAAKVMNMVRDLHGGRDYDPKWGSRMTGTGLFADLMQQRFARAIKKLGLVRSLPDLRTDLFRVPQETDPQLTLF